MGSMCAGENDVIWRQYLDRRHHDIPLSALKDETVYLLATYLDFEMRSLDSDFNTDFTGIAWIVGLNIGFVEPLRLSRLAIPTFRIIRKWQTYCIPKLKPTIGNLIRTLLRLNREDVIAGCMEAISGDAREFLFAHDGHFDSFTEECTIQNSEILTIDDMEYRKVVHYDAFVIWKEDSENIQSLMEILRILEEAPYNLRFYVPERNCLFGVNKFESDAKVMDERCQHVIIFYSRDCRNSDTFSFQASIAVSLAVKDQSRHIVPVLIEDCSENDLPSYLQMKNVWNFTRQQDKLAWRQLALSLCRF